MRIVQPPPTTTRRWRVAGAAPGGAARFERLGLAVTSLVLLFGLWLTYIEQAATFSTFAADVQNGALVNVSSIRDESALIPHLTMFTERAERAFIRGDRRRLARALANLIDNAIAYGGGEPEVSIADANPADEPLTHVQIGVEDHGPGVPIEERALVFERFARGVTAGRRSGSEGAGLGLALVDEHVRIHGGRVWVEDRRDGTPGARFVIELPAHEAAPDAEAAEDADLA